MIGDALLVRVGTGGDPSKDMVDVFKGPQFDRSPGWWSRTWSAVGRFFHALSFSWLGPVGQFVLWLLLIVAAIVLIAWLWRAWQRSGRRWPWHRKQRTPSDDVVPIAIDTMTDPAELRDERTSFQEQRDFKQAILFRYRELVATLMIQRLVSVEPGRTTGELRADLARSSPTASGSFGQATSIFEIAWYSDQQSTQAAFDLLDQLANDTLATCNATAGASA